MSDDLAVASSATPEPTVPLTATEQAVAAGDVTAFREAKQAERVGKPLEPLPADSASAVPESQAAETSASSSPASEPGKTGHKGNAETRKAELEAEIRDLLTQRATLRREIQPATPELTKPAASSPAPAPGVVYPPELASVEAYIAAHPEASYEDYLDARADVRVEAKLSAREQAAQAKAAADGQQREFGERGAAFKSRIVEAEKTEPSFWSKVSAEVSGLEPSATANLSGRPVGPLNVLADEILLSEQGPAIMLHLSAHPDELSRFSTLPYQALLKAFGALEHRLSDTKPDRTPPKTVTDAPRPPRTVGHRAGDQGGDELEAAVKNDDVAAFRAEKLRRRAAALVR
jgi:hypothetical protein